MRHQFIEGFGGEAVLVLARAGIGVLPGEAREQGDFQGGKITNGLGDNDALARRRKHSIDHRGGIGEEVIEGGLH